MDSLAVSGRRPPTPRTRRQRSPTPPRRPALGHRSEDVQRGDQRRRGRQPAGHARREAKQAGKATGLVTTAQVTDATPAAFFSRDPRPRPAGRHRPAVPRGQQARRRSSAAARTGGCRPVRPAPTRTTRPSDTAEGSRGRRANLIAQAQESGYEYVTAPTSWPTPRATGCSGCSPTRRCSSSAPRARATSTHPVVALADHDRKALDALPRRGGLLPAGRGGGHRRDRATRTTARGCCRRCASSSSRRRSPGTTSREHPDTLLIVTGDHESGGLTVEEVDADDESGPGGMLAAGHRGGDTIRGGRPVPRAAVTSSSSWTGPPAVTPAWPTPSPPRAPAASGSPGTTRTPTCTRSSATSWWTEGRPSAARRQLAGAAAGEPVLRRGRR